MEALHWLKPYPSYILDVTPEIGNGGVFEELLFQDAPRYCREKFEHESYLLSSELHCGKILVLGTWEWKFVEVCAALGLTNVELAYSFKKPERTYNTEKPVVFKAKTGGAHGSVDVVILRVFGGHGAVKFYGQAIALLHEDEKTKMRTTETICLLDARCIQSTTYGDETGLNKLGPQVANSIVIVGDVEKLDKSFGEIPDTAKWWKSSQPAGKYLTVMSNSQFGYRSYVDGERKVLLLGSMLSFWADTSSVLAEALVRLGAIGIYHVGAKVGSFVREDVNGRAFAPESASLIVGHEILGPFTNVFKDLPVTQHGKHISIESPLDETSINLVQSKKTGVVSMDLEGGYIAKVCGDATIEFGAAYYASDLIEKGQQSGPSTSVTRAKDSNVVNLQRDTAASIVLEYFNFCFMPHPQRVLHQSSERIGSIHSRDLNYGAMSKAATNGFGVSGDGAPTSNFVVFLKCTEISLTCGCTDSEHIDALNRIISAVPTIMSATKFAVDTSEVHRDDDSLSVLITFGLKRGSERIQLLLILGPKPDTNFEACRNIAYNQLRGTMGGANVYETTLFATDLSVETSNVHSCSGRGVWATQEVWSDPSCVVCQSLEDRSMTENAFHVQGDPESRANEPSGLWCNVGGLVAQLMYRMTRITCRISPKTARNSDTISWLRWGWIRAISRGSLQLVVEVPTVMRKVLEEEFDLEVVDERSPLALAWTLNNQVTAFPSETSLREDESHICSRCKAFDTWVNCWTAYALIDMKVQADARSGRFSSLSAWDETLIRSHGGVAQSVSLVLEKRSVMALTALLRLFRNWKFLLKICGPRSWRFIYSVYDLCYFFPHITGKSPSCDVSFAILILQTYVSFLDYAKWNVRRREWKFNGTLPIVAEYIARTVNTHAPDLRHTTIQDKLLLLVLQVYGRALYFTSPQIRGKAILMLSSLPWDDLKRSLKSLYDRKERDLSLVSRNDDELYEGPELDSNFGRGVTLSFKMDDPVPSFEWVSMHLLVQEVLQAMLSASMLHTRGSLSERKQYDLKESDWITLSNSLVRFISLISKSTLEDAANIHVLAVKVLSAMCNANPAVQTNLTAKRHLIDSTVSLMKGHDFDPTFYAARSLLVSMSYKAVPDQIVGALLRHVQGKPIPKMGKSLKVYHAIATLLQTSLRLSATHATRLLELINSRPQGHLVPSSHQVLLAAADWEVLGLCVAADRDAWRTTVKNKLDLHRRYLLHEAPMGRATSSNFLTTSLHLAFRSCIRMFACGNQETVLDVLPQIARINHLSIGDEAYGDDLSKEREVYLEFFARLGVPMYPKFIKKVYSARSLALPTDLASRLLRNGDLYTRIRARMQLVGESDDDIVDMLRSGILVLLANVLSDFCMIHLSSYYGRARLNCRKPVWSRAGSAIQVHAVDLRDTIEDQIQSVTDILGNVGQGMGRERQVFLGGSDDDVEFIVSHGFSAFAYYIYELSSLPQAPIAMEVDEVFGVGDDNPGSAIQQAHWAVRGTAKRPAILAVSPRENVLGWARFEDENISGIFVFKELDQS